MYQDKASKREFMIMFRWVSDSSSIVIRINGSWLYIFSAYEDRLLAENMVASGEYMSRFVSFHFRLTNDMQDFDNLLLFGREVIKRYPHVTSFVRHFLVDEVWFVYGIDSSNLSWVYHMQFQDTNSVQYDIVRYATQAAGKNLTIVGGGSLHYPMNHKLSLLSEPW